MSISCIFLYENHRVKGSTQHHNPLDKDLVMLAMNVFPHSWKYFIQGISGRDELPKFYWLRVDCIKEECMLKTRGVGRKTHYEDDHVLAAHTSKHKREEI